MTKKPDSPAKRACIHYARTDEFWRKGEKYAFLEEKQHVGGIEWRELQPDAKHNWLTEGMREEFETFWSMGTKEAKKTYSSQSETIFRSYSTGVKTARDTVVYNFSKDNLAVNVEHFCDEYNAEVARYQQKGKSVDIDSFLKYDKIKWSRNLKRDLKSQRRINFNEKNIRLGAYRPFVEQHLYFDEVIIDERGRNQSYFPSPETENENLIICLAGVGDRKGFGCLATNHIASLDFAFEKAQCFPFYTYDEDGTNRRENITDWALEKFRSHYGDQKITKWDIFHYVYAVLHHPAYRERYAANLKRELPRIPFAGGVSVGAGLVPARAGAGKRRAGISPAPTSSPHAADVFRDFARAGERLAELHVNYERQPQYPLEIIETPGAALSWRVERMRLSKDKQQIVYNEFLTLAGVPREAFDYRLGNRSALEWVIDQYQVTTDRRSQITNDPNREDDPQYIVRLVEQVITVSLETVKIVRGLPALGLQDEPGA